jgi:hypothetical protein
MTMRIASSLSALGDRSEANAKLSAVFRSFEANSQLYLTKMIGKMSRFPIAAVDHSQGRQAARDS